MPPCNPIGQREFPSIWCFIQFEEACGILYIFCNFHKLHQLELTELVSSKLKR